MGQPDVIQIRFTTFIGVGVSFSWWYSEKKTLNIGISLPFIFIGIFCRKTKENKWLDIK